jgi:hypothetical protein
VEVTFQHSRDDWTAVSVETFCLWLHRLKPMTAEERVGSTFFLIVSVLAIFGLLGFVVAGAWLNFAWYQIVGAALVLGLPCLVIRAVLHPSDNNSKRGLFHEMIFHLKWQDQLVAKMREKHDRHFRRMEAAGQLDLRHRYVCRIEDETLVWITTYPTQSTSATTQEDRIPWLAVTGIERGERLLGIHLDTGGILGVPRSAFADGQAEESFVSAAEARRAASRERVMVPVG